MTLPSLRRTFAPLLLALLLVAASVEYSRADVLQCPYPATGFLARVLPLLGEAIGYICNYPTERNLSHLHAEYGGYTTNGNVGGNAPAPGLQGINGGIQLGVGLILWSQSYRCPDERYIAAPPNGYGWWKDELNWKGVKCPAVSRAPLALDAPWPPTDPNIAVVVNQILPPGAPDPTAAPPGQPPLPEAHPAKPGDPAPDPAPAAPPGPGLPGILAPVPTAPIPLAPNGTGN